MVSDENMKEDNNLLNLLNRGPCWPTRSIACPYSILSTFQLMKQYPCEAWNLHACPDIQHGKRIHAVPLDDSVEGLSRDCFYVYLKVSHFIPSLIF